MKKIIIIIVASFLADIGYGQVNRYETAQPQKYQSTYVPLDWNFMMKAGETIQARYEQNREYRGKIIDWIFALKKQSYDVEFLSALDDYYLQLRAMDGKDFNQLGDQLDIIVQNIKVEIDKTNTRAKEAPQRLWAKGNENLKNKSYAQAISDYTSLIQMSPDFIYVYVNRAYAYLQTGKHQLAINDFDKFIDKNPTDDRALFLRGISKYEISDFKGAFVDFNAKIELDPKSADAYLQRGRTKSALNDFYGSISDNSKAIELEPNFSMAYNNRGWSKFELKKYSEALIDINKSIELDPTNWVALDSRQQTKFMLNDLAGCIEDCNKGLSLNSKISNSFFYRGRAYYKQGNKSKACEDWSKAGELGCTEAYEYITKYCNN